MEELSITLLLLSFLESAIITILVYSLLSLQINSFKFGALVIILSIAKPLIRSFPVNPFVIMIFSIIIYVIYLKLFHNIPIIIGAFSSAVSSLVQSLLEGILVPIFLNLLGLSIQDMLDNTILRFSAFFMVAGVMIIIIYLVRHYKLNLMELEQLFIVDNLQVLSEDEIDFNREKRVTSTIYLVIFFLLIQGLFINIFILMGNLPTNFKFNNFFTSHFFVISFILILNLVLLYLLRYLVITLRLERDDIIKRIKEKNAMRLDWEKRSQMHDRNHHLSMLYMLLQMKKIDRARDYLKGMVGEIQMVDAIVKSGNQTLNALIRSKISLGKNQGVNVKLTVNNTLQDMYVKDWDLNRIIGNLLDNAIEAAEKKEGNNEVELIIDSNQLINTFEVITYGVVIPDNVESHIFVRGYSSKEEQGHGLGLAICKELVDTYQGEISIQKSWEEEYTCFRVALPVFVDSL